MDSRISCNLQAYGLKYLHYAVDLPLTSSQVGQEERQQEKDSEIISSLWPPPHPPINWNEQFCQSLGSHCQQDEDYAALTCEGKEGKRVRKKGNLAYCWHSF